jgi:hypothetical protein
LATGMSPGTCNNPSRLGSQGWKNATTSVSSKKIFPQISSRDFEDIWSDSVAAHYQIFELQFPKSSSWASANASSVRDCTFAMVMRQQEFVTPNQHNTVRSVDLCLNKWLYQILKINFQTRLSWCYKWTWADFHYYMQM